jgi:hypothetical protein
VTSVDDVTLSGPLFDGRAAKAAKDGTDAIRRALADEARKLALAAFTASIRENHGHFLATLTETGESRAYSSRSGGKTYTMPVVVDDPATDIVVTTDLATYGPWLEGTGSRNLTTRFHGYHGFRLAGQELDRAAQDIADGAFAPFVEAMR